MPESTEGVEEGHIWEVPWKFEPALLMKWIFKTAISVWFISNTFNIVMAVFDVTQQVVANSSGIISGNTRVNDIGLSMLESSMMNLDVGPLFGLFLQSFFMYQKNGQPAEKLLMYYIRARFLRPKVRPYQTHNYYALLMKGDAHRAGRCVGTCDRQP